MMLMTGWRSHISEEVRIIAGKRNGEKFDKLDTKAVQVNAERYLFCAGVMLGKAPDKCTWSEEAELLDVNLMTVIHCCEKILSANHNARICIVGSESGIAGSKDRLYGASKAALHNYVETRRVGRWQQLVAVAPGIIADAGMTLRREDTGNLALRLQAHPKGRFLACQEVARLIYFLMYEDNGFICNTVVRMNGGEHTK